MTVAKVSGREQWALPLTYVDAVQAAGGVPIPIPLLGAHERLGAFCDGLDGLVLCGGGDVAPEAYGAHDRGHCSHVVPARDAVELYLTRRALAQGLPLLAICRGIQVLNVAAGGTLIQDIPSALPNALPHATPATCRRDHLAHPVRLEPDSLLSRMCVASRPDGRFAPELRVNSMHHQAIDSVGCELRVTARAPDGIIEAVEGTSPDSFIVGVQWHPEELQHGPDGLHRELFKNLVRHAHGAQEE